MKINGYNLHAFKNLGDIDTNQTTPERIELFGNLFNENYDNIYVSGGFQHACKIGLIPFEISLKTKSASVDFEYHHIAVIFEDCEAPEIYCVLFKEEE